MHNKVQMVLLYCLIPSFKTYLDFITNNTGMEFISILCNDYFNGSIQSCHEKNPHKYISDFLYGEISLWDYEMCLDIDE